MMIPEDSKQQNIKKIRVARSVVAYPHGEPANQGGNIFLSCTLLYKYLVF